jgi:hypothetical protein
MFAGGSYLPQRHLPLPSDENTYPLYCSNIEPLIDSKYEMQTIELLNFFAYNE